MRFASRPQRYLSLLSATLLLLGVLAGTLHHHARAQSERDCPVCLLSHAPATTAPTPMPAAPSLRVESLVLVGPSAPHEHAAAAPQSRGPPSA